MAFFVFSFRKSLEGPVQNVYSVEDDKSYGNHDLEKNLRKRSCQADTPMIVLPTAPPRDEDERPRLARSDSQDNLLPTGSSIDEEDDEKKIDNREADRERKIERRDASPKSS